MTQEDKDFIELTMQGTNARIESNYVVINTKLDGINEHLATLNGKVVKHEVAINQALQERSGNRQKQDTYFEKTENLDEDVTQLKDYNITAKAMKNYNAKLFAISTTVLGLLIGIIGLWLKTQI